MTYDQLITHYGTNRAICEAFNVHKATVSLWKTKGISQDTQYRLEVLSGGLFKADREPSHSA